MKEGYTRSRAISDISCLRLRAREGYYIGEDAATKIINEAFSLWMRVDGDPKEEEFAHTMGRLALHAMAWRQIEFANAIIDAGYMPCRNAWILSGSVAHPSVGGLAHCLATMDLECREQKGMPERTEVLEAALSRLDRWGDVLAVDEIHHGLDALVATEDAHWRSLRKRHGLDNTALHEERARFQQALIKAGCQISRPETCYGLLAASVPAFAAPPADIQAGLSHMRQVIEWGGANTIMARAGAWTSAIRRDVHQVLADPTRAGPRVNLLDSMGVALEAPSRSGVRAGVALAALQKGYLPVVERLIAAGKGFDWLDETDNTGILAKLGGNRLEMEQAVDRVPRGWLAPPAGSRVNAISVQAANGNGKLLERAIAEGWPLADAMGQGKTPLEKISKREPTKTQTPEILRHTLQCLVRSCQSHNIDMEVDTSLLKFAVRIRDLSSLKLLWECAAQSPTEIQIDELLEACCQAQAGIQNIEMQSSASQEIFDFLWMQKKTDPESQVLVKWLGLTLNSRNRAIFDRLSQYVERAEGSAWPATPHSEDMSRAEDLAHMVEVMIRKGADGEPPTTWATQQPLRDVVRSIHSRQMLAIHTHDVPRKGRPAGRL